MALGPLSPEQIESGDVIFLPMKLFLYFTTLLALPILQNTHDTQIRVLSSETTRDRSSFIVEVTRQDELKDDDDLKATQTQVVLLSIDVENDELLVNNQPVGMGLTTMQVEASTMIGTADNFTVDEALDNMAIGIIDVEIQAEGETVEEDGQIYRQIRLVERVVAIDGDTVEQEEASQLVVQIFSDGFIVRSSLDEDDMDEDCMHSKDDEDPADSLRVCPFMTGSLLLLGFALVGLAMYIRKVRSKQLTESATKKGEAKYEPVYSPPPPYKK
jgi:hypothetical protein